MIIFASGGPLGGEEEATRAHFRERSHHLFAKAWNFHSDRVSNRIMQICEIVEKKKNKKKKEKEQEIFVDQSGGTIKLSPLRPGYIFV